MGDAGLPGAAPGDRTHPPLARVVVVGATGSGKSTFAQPAHWTEAAPDVFRARVERATAGPRWAVAGNYGRVRDLLWPRADTIVWLDYAFPLVLRRLTVRTVRRAVTGEILWNGNRESLWEHCRLWSQKSLFHWLFKTYWAYRRELPVLFAQPAHAHLRITRLRRPREADAWLAGLAPE